LEDRVALEADEAGAIVVLDDSAVVGVFVEHAYEAAGPDLELGLGGDARDLEALKKG
jgi:hypothetical protein